MVNAPQQQKQKTETSKKTSVEGSQPKRQRIAEASRPIMKTPGSSSQAEDKRKVHFSASTPPTPVLLAKQKPKEIAKENPAGKNSTKDDRKRPATDEAQAKRTKHEVELDGVLNMEKNIGELFTDITRLTISSEDVAKTSTGSISDVVSCLLEKIGVLRSISVQLDEVDVDTEKNLSSINLEDVDKELDNCFFWLERLSELENRVSEVLQFSAADDLDDILCHLDAIEREKNFLLSHFSGIVP